MSRPRVSKQEFEYRILQRFPTESFTVLSYESLGKPSVIKCNKCGTEIPVSCAGNFLVATKAFGCKQCNGLWRDRERKLNLIKERYEIIKTYVKETHTYYVVKCKKCGHVRNTSLRNLTKNLACGCETGVKRNKTPDEFINQVNEHSVEGTYTLISEYKGQTKKVLLRHNSCGFIWKVRPADVLNGRSRCPKCGRKESKGAKFVEKQLRELNIIFDKEHQLENSLQRFDFYVETPLHKIAIEYNGAQHYLEVSFYHDSLKLRQELDNRKRQYCKDNNIILLELPYWLTEQEISNILKELVQRLVLMDVGSSDPK